MESRRTPAKVADPVLEPLVELPSLREPRLARLEVEAREAFRDLLPGEQAFARYVVCGHRWADAAIRAGFKPATGRALMKNPRIRRAVSVGTEFADLKAGVDPVWVRTKLRNVIALGERRGEPKYVLAALRLLADISGMTKPDVAQGGPPVIVQVALALPQRETPPSFLARSSTLALAPAPELADLLA
jgi:hypothetical protein